MTGGFRPEGIEHLRSSLEGHVTSGEVPGIAALVARGDVVHAIGIGTIAFDDPTPMGTDTLVRIASLTKPVAAAAAMLLVEEGALDLAEPVDRLLPELADRQVLRTLESELDDTIPAERPITVEDLLTFRLGFGCVMTPPRSTPIQRAEEQLGLMTMGPPWPPPDFDHDEWIRRFATLPLLAQPGERWFYNTGAQVLGALIERAAGVPLGEFMEYRLFGPLGMGDTAFSWPASAEGRVATAYAPDEDGRPRLFDRPDGYWAEPPALPNAAAWLVSTADDYWAFARMLRDRGLTASGRRLLSEASVHAMTSDHLDAAQRSEAELFLGGSGWGYCMAVPPAGGGEQRTPGYGWDGGSGTVWRNDPFTGLTGILFTQLQLRSPEPPAAFTDFWDAAYSALDG